MALVRHSPLPYISEFLGKEFPREPGGSRQVSLLHSGESNQGAARSPDRLSPRHLRHPGRRIVRGGQVRRPSRTRRSHMQIVTGNHGITTALRNGVRANLVSVTGNSGPLPCGSFGKREADRGTGIVVTRVRPVAALDRQFIRHWQNRFCSKNRFMASDGRMREPTTGKTQRRNMT